MREIERTSREARPTLCALARHVKASGDVVLISRQGMLEVALVRCEQARSLAGDRTRLPISEAKRLFPAMLDSCYAGRRYELRRHGKAVATLIGWEDYCKLLAGAVAEPVDAGDLKSPVAEAT